MDPAATTASFSSSASTWRRRSLAGAAMLLHAANEREEPEPGCCRRSRGRVRELEATVVRLRAEKEAAERGAAALRAELESEQGAAETATSEVMLMIVRLQREKAAAMIEARAFRRVADTRAGRVRELQDQLAGVHHALAASYQLALLHAHGGGIDDNPDGDDHETVHHECEAKCAAAVEEPSRSPPPAAEEFEDKYAVHVRTKPVPAEEDHRVVDVAEGLCTRVEALEADSAAVRREVATLRAQAVLSRQLCSTDEKQSFSVLTIFKCFFSTILRGIKRSASAARKLPPSISSSPTAFFLLGLLPLLERSKGTLRIHSKTSRQPAHPHGQLEYSMLCYSF